MEDEESEREDRGSEDDDEMKNMRAREGSESGGREEVK